ncbi:hypothetical protein C8J56DRAFT_1136411, partial [Mycena floridula]
ANQNESTVKLLRLGLIVPSVVALLFRILFRSSSLPPSLSSILLYIVISLPALFLSNHLIKTGSTRRDPTTGALISYGEDLNQAGVTEWCLDIVYITWACQLGSGAFGDWFWWFYMVIPVYAVFKLWTSVIGPMFFGKSAEAPSAEQEKEPTSKRQEKLRKRNERGDTRVSRK